MAYQSTVTVAEADKRAFETLSKPEFNWPCKDCSKYEKCNKSCAKHLDWLDDMFFLIRENSKK